MGRYPFKLKVKDPKLGNILDRLQKDRVCSVDKSMSKSLGWKVKPIRKDFRITRDFSFDNQSFVHLQPYLKIKKKGKDKYIFDKIL